MAAAILGTGVVVYMAVVPKIPVYEFAVLSPPRLGWGDSWGEWKATLYAKLYIQNKNIFPTHVHAATFDLFFPTWDGDFVHLGHVVDRHQPFTPTEAFWKLKANNLFQMEDSVILRIPLKNVYYIFSHLLYQIFRGSGVLNVMSTGATHISIPGGNIKVTLTFICDTNLNVFTNRMIGSSCAIDRLTPGKWIDMMTVTEAMQATALSLHPDPIEGTVLVNGKPQKKVSGIAT
jgi:hypothetical protein